MYAVLLRLSRVCIVIQGCFLCLYLFSFTDCSGMCSSSKLLNLSAHIHILLILQAVSDFHLAMILV